MLTKITVENFKAFGGETVIHIAPITLLFGKNSSGKSTFLHAVGLVDDIFRALILPPLKDNLTKQEMLVQSQPIRSSALDRLSPDSEPNHRKATQSNITDRAWERCQYSNLVHNFDKSRQMRIRLDFRDGQGQFGLELKCFGLQETSKDAMMVPGKIPTWPFELRIYIDEEESPSQRIINDGKAPVQPIPVEIENRVLAEFRLFAHAPSHRPIWKPTAIGTSTGFVSNLPLDISSDLKNPNTLECINFLLREVDDRYEINEQAQIRLRQKRDGASLGPWMNLTSVGSGIGQMLPILHLCAAKNGCNLFLQQPEEELHPKAQCDMGDVLIHSALNNQTFIVAETHSEHLLLRILRRIREKRITFQDYSEKVLVYYIEDGHAHLYAVEPDGTFRINGWPSGFFEERHAELGLDP